MNPDVDYMTISASSRTDSTQENLLISSPSFKGGNRLFERGMMTFETVDYAAFGVRMTMVGTFMAPRAFTPLQASL